MRLKDWVAAMVVVILCGVMLVGSATAGEQPKPGGTLRIAFASDIHSGRFTLNRRSPAGAETGWVMHNTHSRLVTLDPNFGLAPDLAKSWDVIDGGKAYVFHPTAPTRLEEDYRAGRTTQVPAGRVVAVTKRVRRRIGYNGTYLSFERA